MPKISVIIPVYNVEKYLRQCLDSVINQTFKDLEIICVNDASTDNSLCILEEYAQKDNRIVIFQNEKNSGLGLTRNHGLKYATGEYIHFLDSDDWVEPDIYEKILADLPECHDVVSFLWNNVDVKNGKIRQEKFKEYVVNGNFKTNPEIIDNWKISVWNKLYRRDFLISNGLVFNDFPCMEDIEFSYKVLLLAHDIKFINKILLNYRYNNSKSLIGRFYKYPQCVINSYKAVYEFTGENLFNGKDRYFSNLLDNILYRLVGCYCFGTLNFNDLKDIVSNFDYSMFISDRKSYKWYIYYNEIMNYPSFVIKLKYKIRLFLKNYCYRLYEIFKRNNKS